MDITTEQYQKIIRFLDGAMEPAEMEEFEKEMVSKPEMRQQLDFEQLVRDDFTLRNIISLPGASSANGNAPVRVMPGKIGIRKWLAIGAAVITGFILLTVFWPKKGETPHLANIRDTPPKAASQAPTTAIAPAKDGGKVIDLVSLFQQYFKKDALPDQYPVFLAEALTDYESGKYTTLQQLDLNDLPQTRGTGESDSQKNILKWGHYYKGLAFLQTDNTGEALVNLDWVLNNQPDKALKAKTQWYLALAYLKENNGQKAGELCRGIINNNENDILVKNAKKIRDTLSK